MTHLPDAGRVRVEDAKVRDYLLGSNHPQNGGKSSFFRAFGFNAASWTVPRDALVEHAVINSLTETSSSPHGIKYVVRGSLRTPDGRNPCLSTVWIAQNDHPPRLVTAYP